MEEIVVLIFQFVIEVGIQIFGGLGLDLAASRRSDDKSEAGCGWVVVFAVVGAIFGGLSLLVAPNLMLPNMGLRIGNLVVSPLIAGGVSYLVAKNMRSSGPADEHFWRGFLFAFAFGVVRFAYAHR